MKGLKHSYLIVLFVLFGFNESTAQLKIYYIRHAEGGHNVKKEWQLYSGIPEAEWPAYVGNGEIFTPKGKMQQVAVSNKLKRYKFDFIAVSPILRCKNTILTYLEKNDLKGEIWPELKELYHSDIIISPDLKLPPDKILGEGKPIEITPEEMSYFSLREDGLKNFKLPKFPHDHSEKEAETAASKVVIQRVLEIIQERFGGTDTSILLVGHGSSGKGILRMLTKNKLENFPGISNTGVWMVKEQVDGAFKLKMFNDVVIEDLCN